MADRLIHILQTNQPTNRCCLYLHMAHVPAAVVDNMYLGRGCRVHLAWLPGLCCCRCPFLEFNATVVNGTISNDQAAADAGPVLGWGLDPEYTLYEGCNCAPVSAGVRGGGGNGGGGGQEGRSCAQWGGGGGGTGAV